MGEREVQPQRRGEGPQNQQPLEELSMPKTSFVVFQQPEEGRRRPRLPAREGLATVTIPELSTLGYADFDRQMKGIISSLAEHSEYFKKLEEAVKDKGYTFVRYNEDRPEIRGLPAIPESIDQRMKDGSYCALSLASNNTVYVDIEAIQASARALNYTEGKRFIVTLANEGIHVMRDVQHPHFSRADANEAMERMARSETVTQPEKDLKRFVTEELESFVAMEVVRRIYEDPDFRLPEDGLKENFFQFNHFKFTKAAASMTAMFGGFDPNARDKTEAQALVVADLRDFITSGEIERTIYQRLSRLGLTK